MPKRPSTPLGEVGRNNDSGYEYICFAGPYGDMRYLENHDGAQELIIRYPDGYVEFDIRTVRDLIPVLEMWLETGAFTEEQGDDNADHATTAHATERSDPLPQDQ